MTMKGASMQIVIPVRDSPRNDPLKYTVRAWCTFYPEAEVTIIGGKPLWWRGPHIPTSQNAGPRFQWTKNFPNAMKAAHKAFESPFLWTADDIFPLRRFDDYSTTWCRKTDLDTYLDRWGKVNPNGYTRIFVEGIASQRDILRNQGIDTQHNADMHMPHMLDPNNLRDLMKLLKDDYPEHPAGHFRAIYGGLWPGKVVRVKDPKITTAGSIDESLGWVSTCDYSWRSKIGKIIQKKFPTPSRYERR